jgi:phosphoribosylformylglycinamidine synthase
MKDMGAAGLTCTTCEMSAEGNVGMEIDLDKVPLREADMEAFEIMMSESQERMLAVVAAGREAEAAAVFEKWGLHAARLGHVTDDGVLRIKRNGELVGEMTAKSLADAPLYKLPAVEPEYLADKRVFDYNTIPLPKSYSEVLMKLLQSPNIASKEWVYSQYDHLVQTNTVVRPGAGDAAVLRIKESASNKGIAVTADCNTRYCYLDPYLGAQIAIAEAARNLVCVGAEPAGVTDCLCFGNPDKPDRYWQFARSIEGIVEACQAFRLPVVSGNVSFYNETPESAIHPSPLIGMVGVLDNVEQHVGMGFRDSGDIVVLLGKCRNELGGSEYLAHCHDVEAGRPPMLDINLELNVQRLVLAAIRRGLIKSAHDTAEGGLAIALAECCITGKIGANLEISGAIVERATEQETVRPDAVLFGETQSRVILTVAPENLDALQKMAQLVNVPMTALGAVGGDRLVLHSPAPQLTVIISSAVNELEWAYRGAIPRLMSQ